jgi:fucose permease
MQRRDPTFNVLAYGFVVLGLGLTALQVVWPSVAEDLGRSLGELGYVSVCFGGGYTLTTLISGKLAAHRKIGSLLMAAAVAAVVGLLVLTVSPSWAVYLLGALLLGMSGGLVDAATNSFVAVRRGPREMGYIHGAFGIGAIAGPLLVTALLAAGFPWRISFIVLAIANLIYIAGLWRFARDIAVPSPTRGNRLVQKALWSAPLIWSALVFFFYAGVAAGAGLWAFTLLTEGRGLGDTAGGVVVAAYWAAFTASRFVLGFVGDAAEPNRVLRWSAIATAAAFAVFWWNPNAVVGVIALIAAGFAHGPIFPLEIQLTPLRFGAALTATVVGFEIAAANVGGAALPGLSGLLVDSVGLEVIPPLLFFNALVIWGAIEILRLVSRDAMARVTSETST